MFKGRNRLKMIIKRGKDFRPQNIKPSYAIDCKLTRCNKKATSQSLTTTNIEGNRFDYLFFRSYKKL
ncbi:hypothetical protein SRABI27_04144 [Pedobacter sp. Bi27]|nr:hypothetical protein SRABI36_03536 [Pedobacter sp. Bi36]CAH0290229.1 hypothetical protein SRABI126_04030 [Pedobacter sp. Bi126]CAH0293574.1 hypothetical protein SRABI27_04144 [Pedobacter sp. Bi27]